MKKVNSIMKKSYLLTILIIGLIIQSCEKQENAVVEQKTEQFTVKDGMLVFNTVWDFFNVKGRVANFSDSERQKWEKEIGFKSQKSIFNEIVQAETEIDVVNQTKYTYAEAKNLEPANLHSDLYNKYLKAGVIQIINAGSEDEYWDMPFTQKNFMELVNEKGLYAVAGKIYSVNGGVIKFISDGDFSKIPALLSAGVVDKTNGIEFLNPEASKGTSPGLINTGWVEESGKRIALQVYLAVTYFNYGTSTYSFYHEIYVLNQEKNWLGTWKYKVAETWIDATWVMRVFYMDIVSFSNSWSYHNGISDFKACINPQTGGNPAYRTLFSVTSPYPDIHDSSWQPYWDWTYTTFTAVRIGGAAGITATIPYW